MKAINTLEAAKNLVTAIKADAKAGVSIESLVKKLHAEATKQGHEEAAITEFIKTKMTEVYGDQEQLFKIRWGAARVALCKVRKASGTSPNAEVYKLKANLKKAILDTLKENNVTDKKEQRKALFALAKTLA
jgi:hypothetical protein